MNADGSGKRNLTRNPAQDGSPSWSPDGRRIAFVSNRDGRLEAHVMNADGSGQRSLAGSEERADRLTLGRQSRLMRERSGMSPDRRVGLPVARHAFQHMRAPGLNVRSAPTVRSLTVWETSTSPLSASSPTRAAMCTAIPVRAVLPQLHFPCVEPGADFEAVRPQRVTDRRRTANGACGAVEHGEDAVAGRPDLLPPEAVELRPHHLVVAVEQLAPAAVAELVAVRVEPTMSVTRIVASMRSASCGSGSVARKDRISPTTDSMSP